MEISESNSWKRSKCIVSNNDSILLVRILFNVEMVKEVFSILLFTLRNIAKDKPKNSYKIAECQNNNNQFEYFEHERNPDYLRDIIIVKVRIIRDIRVIFNYFLEFFVIVLLKMEHKLLIWEEICSFLKSNDFDKQEESVLLAFKQISEGDDAQNIKKEVSFDVSLRD